MIYEFLILRIYVSQYWCICLDKIKYKNVIYILSALSTKFRAIFYINERKSSKGKC